MIVMLLYYMCAILYAGLFVLTPMILLFSYILFHRNLTSPVSFPCRGQPEVLGGTHDFPNSVDLRTLHT